MPVTFYAELCRTCKVCLTVLVDRDTGAREEICGLAEGRQIPSRCVREVNTEAPPLWCPVRRRGTVTLEAGPAPTDAVTYALFWTGAPATCDIFETATTCAPLKYVRIGNGPVMPLRQVRIATPRVTRQLSAYEAQGYAAFADTNLEKGLLDTGVDLVPAPKREE